MKGTLSMYMAQDGWTSAVPLGDAVPPSEGVTNGVHAIIVLSSARVWLRVKIQRSHYTSRHAKILKVRELYWHLLCDHSCAHVAAAAEETSGTHKITQLFHRKHDTRAAQLDVATTDRGQPMLSSRCVDALEYVGFAVRTPRS